MTVVWAVLTGIFPILRRIKHSVLQRLAKSFAVTIFLAPCFVGIGHGGGVFPAIVTALGGTWYLLDLIGFQTEGGRYYFKQGIVPILVIWPIAFLISFLSDPRPAGAKASESKSEFSEK